MKISIVIPAHNEEGKLRHFITGLVPVLEKHEETRDYELLKNSVESYPMRDKVVLVMKEMAWVEHAVAMGAEVRKSLKI